jgi:hypothetical protein
MYEFWACVKEEGISLVCEAHPRAPTPNYYRSQSRAVIRTVNYSTISIIKLNVTIRRIFALFEEFNVGFSTFFGSLSK